MHGDYEAQRHWMEITTQLPVSQWYFHDLEWWGLDYPPLTAYHSWLLGKIGSLINPDWFALYTSRGSDDPTLKVFMRATVLASDFAVYVPAAVVFVRRYARINGVSGWTASLALTALLMQPGLILIDHVHFQYNAVMLGFVLASMSGMLAGRFAVPAAFFVAALAFKQMALYYCFPVFFYLLGSCISPKINISRLAGIALATMVTGVIMLLPLVLGTLYDVHRGIDPRPNLDEPRPPLPLFPQLTQYLDTEAIYYPILEQVAQLVFRVFPFARGLFEDKVANFWCALNLVVKIRHYPTELLQRGALLTTLAAALPPSIILLVRPQKTLLPLGLATAAWGFFLFSYQVHEKSVLLPLMPMTLLLAGRDGMNKDTRAWIGFANILGAWTMFPLLRRVDLEVPYAVLTLLWAWLLGLPPTSTSAYLDASQPLWAQIGLAMIHGSIYVAMVAWHVVEAVVQPPNSMPDLWVVANVGIGAVGFGLCYLWCFGKLLVESEVITWSREAQKVKAR
jgi:alpha-1,3-glucosyltransferase